MAATTKVTSMQLRDGKESVNLDAKNPADPVTAGQTDAAPARRPGLKFWLVFLSLWLLGLSNSLEATITTVALPNIIRSLGLDDASAAAGSSQFVWAGSAFLLASTVIQPLVGQLANIFGRRWPLIIFTTLFVLGSGIAGSSHGPHSQSVGMLIAGRTVQGLGSGGVLVLIDVIISDLLPLQQRAKFLGLVRISGAIGSAIGPIIGGALAQANWRWCFYLNIVTAGIALVALLTCLDIRHQPEATWGAALARIDYFGSLLFIGSTTSLLLGLIMGGTAFGWGTANIIVPIVIGVVGLIVFRSYQVSSLCKGPIVPGHLFTTRTSAAGFVLAFDGALLLYWVFWYIAVYFQGVRGALPLQSGVNQLPLNLLLVPAGIIAGGTVTKSGKYKPQHWIGFALISLGLGLFTLLDATTSKVAWAWFEIIIALGLGVILTAILPAIQAALSEADIAASTSMYAFSRSFGGVWGVTIPSVIFNSQIDHFLSSVGDETVRSMLRDGAAYGFASRGSVQHLSEPTRTEVVDVYVAALKTVWQVGLGFALAGFLVVFVERQLSMDRADTGKYGLKEGERTTDSEAAASNTEKRAKEEERGPTEQS